MFFIQYYDCKKDTECLRVSLLTAGILCRHCRAGRTFLKNWLFHKHIIECQYGKKIQSVPSESVWFYNMPVSEEDERFDSSRQAYHFQWPFSDDLHSYHFWNWIRWIKLCEWNMNQSFIICWLWDASFSECFLSALPFLHGHLYKWWPCYLVLVSLY